MGAPAESSDWTPAFEGQRPPFQPGHSLSTRHGGFATVGLSDRVTEIAELIRADLGGDVAPRFVAFVQAAAMAYARLERVWAALDALEPGEGSERLEGELSRWWRNWTAALDRLGMSHMAASKLGLNLALTDEAARLSLRRRAELEAEQAARKRAAAEQGGGA